VKAIFFIESPLQLLNAYEAKSFFEVQEYIYYIRFSGLVNNDKQLLNLIKVLDLKNIERITINTTSRSIKDYITLLYYKYIYKVPSSFDKVFIGNFDSGFFNLIIKKINKSKIILLDDGAKSIDIQKNFSEENYYNLFTMYNLKIFSQQKVFKNSYNQLQKNLKNITRNKNKILFLGLKLSEIGIVTEEYYLQQIQKIVNNYGEKELIYISHRGENRNKIDKIIAIQNIKVLELDYPVELYGLYNEEIPYKVASFYSTALYTMKNIYNIEAESFMFDFSHSKYKTTIANVYSYYEKYFEVIDLND